MKTPILGAILSAVLYVLSFPPFGFFWLAFLSPLPWIYSLNYADKGRETKAAVISGWIFGIGIGLGGFSWVAHSSSRYGGFPYAVGLIFLLLFAVTNQLTWPAYGYLRATIQKHFPRLGLFWIPISGIIFAGLENIIPKLFEDTYGNVTVSSPAYRQLAEFGGASFISALFLAWAECLNFAIQSLKTFKTNPNKIPHVCTSVFAMLWIGLSQYGEKRVLEIDQQFQTAQNSDRTLKATVIQANIGDNLKEQSERGVRGAFEKVVDTYSAMSAQNTDTDLIVWPETAYPHLFDKPRSAFEKELVARAIYWKPSFRGTLALGGYDQKNGLDYNSFFFLKPNEIKASDIYYKSILLTFGETLPFADQLAFVKKLIPNMGFFGHGNGPTVFSIPNSKGDLFFASPSICYEGLFPWFSLESARQNADFLLNITNDSWFGNTGEPELHLALTVFRSIETRTPMLRGTNTGITTLISPTGETLNATKVGEQTAAKFIIPKRLEMARPGLWAVPLWQNFSRLLAIIACIAVFLKIRRKS